VAARARSGEAEAITLDETRKTAETSCSGAIAVAARATSSEAEAKQKHAMSSGERGRGKLRKTVGTSCSEAVAVASCSNSSEAEAKTWNETQASEVRTNSAKTAETDCSEAIGVAARTVSSEVEARTRRTRGRGEFKRAVGTGGSEAIVVAARTSSWLRPPPGMRSEDLRLRRNQENSGGWHQRGNRGGSSSQLK
jgi:hypothetical protein